MLHGVDLSDAYRWLEDQEAPDTRASIDVQNDYTDSILKMLPGREELRATVTRVLERDVTGLPNERGGRYFFEKRRADQDLAVLYVRDGVDGDDEILIDPHPMSPDHTVSVDYSDISADGSLVAYAVRDGGVDEVSIRLMNIDTREDLPDVLPEARYGAIWITPDNRGMFYERYGDVTPKVMYHEFGTDRDDDLMLFGDGYQRHHIPVTVMSPDGRWLLVHVIEGSSGPTEVHVKDLANDGPFKTAIADGVSENWAEFAGDRIVITTNLDAPNKRVVVVDPATRPSSIGKKSFPSAMMSWCRMSARVVAGSPCRISVTCNLGWRFMSSVESTCATSRLTCWGRSAVAPARGRAMRCSSPSRPSTYRAPSIAMIFDPVSRTFGPRPPRPSPHPHTRSSRCGSHRLTVRVSRCSSCMRLTSCATAHRRRC